MSSGSASVDLTDLSQAVLLVPDEVQRLAGRTVVDLGADSYWQLASRDIYEAADPPSASSLGSLSDDVESVSELLSREPGEVYVWHDLGHIVGVLTRMAIAAEPHE